MRVLMVNTGRLSPGRERWVDTATGKGYRTESDDDCLISLTPHADGSYRSSVVTYSASYIYRAKAPCAACGVAGCLCWAQPSTTSYPDGNPKSLQGAKKYSLRYFPLPANIAVNQALEDGAKKYGPANWREKGVAASVYVDAALRHISQYFDGGQDHAADSGVHNLGHAMACLAIIIDAEANGTLTNDRPFACRDTDTLLKRS